MAKNCFFLSEVDDEYIAGETKLTERSLLELLRLVAVTFLQTARSRFLDTADFEYSASAIHPIINSGPVQRHLSNLPLVEGRKCRRAKSDSPLLGQSASLISSFGFVGVGF